MLKRCSWTVGLYGLVFLAISCQPSNETSELFAKNPAGLQANGLQAALAPRLALSEASGSGLGLELDGGRFAVGAQNRGAELFNTLDCPGCGVTNELGRPRLPVVRKLVEVPAGAQPAVELGQVEVRRLHLEELGARHRILPVQRPVPKMPGALEQAPFDIDTELYARDAFYPEQAVSLSEPIFVRGHQFVQIEVRPVRYNPASGEVEVIQRARLQLDFGQIAANRALALVPRPSPAFDAWLSREVIAYRPARVARGISTDKYAEGILVIAGDAYADDAQLAAYLEDRRAEGHRVELTAMADIGNTTAQVRAYIRGEYLAWSQPSLSYVLLVGDTTDVPVYTGNGGGNSQVTDLYYASIDPDNYTSDLLAPDLMVSRISVNDAIELATYLTRAEHYVWADWATDTGWLHRASFLASCDNSNITEGTHNYVINNYTSPLGFTGSYPADPQAGGDQLYCASGDTSQANIQTHLGHGRGIINFSGHGGETEWADPSFTQAYLTGITPPDAAPFVISNACLTGSYGRAGGDCWGEMWLGHSHGAILFWGSSNNSYWDQDDILERRHWDGVFTNGLTRLADGILNAKLQLLAHYGANDDMRYYFEMYNALGDATLDLYTDVAFDAVVTHPNEIPVGVDTLDVTVSQGGSALEGALVCARGGAVQQVGTTDVAGHVQLVMNPPPADVGTLTLTVTAHNMRRYAGSILVVPADGPYLVHAGHEITSDGTTVVDPNPGRHVVLPIDLHDIGNEPATGISATLSSTSPLVQITQPQPTFSDIAIDGQGRSIVHAELDIDPAATDGALIDLRLDWTAQGGWAGTTRFSLTVVRPHLVYAGHTVDDSLAGCDADGIGDVDEATTFRVMLTNQGSGDANGVSVNLSAPGCDVSGPASLGTVPSGQSAEASFLVTPQFGMACPAPVVDFSVAADATELPAADTSGFTEVLNGDIEGFTFSDDMEGTEPNGWTHGANSGSDDWAYVASSSHSPTHAWWTSDPASGSEKWLQTPPVTIGDTAELRFWQRVACEDGYDGGRLEISVDGGAWNDLGPYITQGVYNDAIGEYSSSPFAGLDVWSGDLAWHEVVADLSGFGPGEVQLQFHFASDGSVGDNGWWIDDLNIDAETLVCQAQLCSDENRAPVADAGPDQNVEGNSLVQLDGSGSQDPNLDPLEYTWSQTGGPAVSLSDPNATQPTFDAPDPAGELSLTFELSVFDGEFYDADSVTITVWGCDDGEACTTDAFTGDGCSHTPLADCALCGLDGVCMGAVCQAGGQNQAVACDDGDGCTQTDTCQAGACVGVDPVVCQALDDCHLVGSCNPATGECNNPAAPNGTACDDGDGCTQADTCRSGACQGANPVDCGAIDACHLDGACDPATGECSQPEAPDDTACDDGDACTQTDTCQAGACVGVDPVECEAQDDCQTAACDAATGACVVSAQPDGTTCDDEDACTQSDTCQQGTCTGADPVVCEALDQCHLSGTCDPASGECSQPEAPEGTFCDDENACTDEDSCSQGVCAGVDLVPCKASDECHLAGSCDPATGECSDPAAPDDTVCSIGVCQAGDCVEESGGGSGCGCGMGTRPTAGLWLVLLGLLLVSRRRRA